MSYNLKITVYNNRDYEQSFTLQDSVGDPYNLTGLKLIFGIGTEKASITSHTSGSPSNKCIFIDDAPNGAFTLKLPYVVLKNLNPNVYIHDLILIDADDDRVGIWSGKLVVKKGVA
jgi:hypothetical protein